MPLLVPIQSSNPMTETKYRKYKYPFAEKVCHAVQSCLSLRKSYSIYSHPNVFRIIALIKLPAMKRRL